MRKNSFLLSMTCIRKVIESHRIKLEAFSEHRSMNTESNKVCKPVTVEQEDENNHHQFRSEQFVCGNSVTTNDLLTFLNRECRTDFAPNALQQRLPIASELWSVKDIRLKQGRVECDPGEIQVSFEERPKVINGKLAALLFNLDMSDFWDWPDKLVRPGTVLASHKDEEFPIPVDRGAKRTSLLLCISFVREVFSQEKGQKLSQSSKESVLNWQ
jgi:hypothetical protein